MINDRIAIIGGGLSGLVMAHRLKEKGYENISIFEKENRLGGKLHTIEFKGRSYELGAVFGLPSYENLKNLLARLNIESDGPKLSRVNYNSRGEKISPIPKECLMEFLVELERLPEELKRYKNIDSPNIEDLDKLLMLSFSDWCDIHGFKVLKTVYINYFTVFGMGNIEDVPALYVLRVMNYEDLMCFMQIPEFFTWENGISDIAKALAKDLNDIRLGQKVEDIKLNKDSSLTLSTAYEDLVYDKVIISCPLDEFKDLELFPRDIQDFLGEIKYQNFNVYSFIVENVPKGLGCIVENFNREREGHITMWDSRWDLGEEEGLLVVYAYDPQDRSQNSLNIIKEDLVKLGARNPRLYQMKKWKHSPYVDRDILEKGFYERLNQIQGANNIFLAGEIMSVISLENTVEYGEYLVDKYF